MSAEEHGRAIRRELDIKLALEPDLTSEVAIVTARNEAIRRMYQDGVLPASHVLEVVSWYDSHAKTLRKGSLSPAERVALRTFATYPELLSEAWDRTRFHEAAALAVDKHDVRAGPEGWDGSYLADGEVVSAKRAGDAGRRFWQRFNFVE